MTTLYIITAVLLAAGLVLRHWTHKLKNRIREE